MNYMTFDPILLTAGILLFGVVAVGMLLAPLLIGWLLRPDAPNKEKLAVYECGEPTIGSSNVQFDLRFYVVALLFIVFDVEVAFFFPWAVVFGKANALASSQFAIDDTVKAERIRVQLSQALSGDLTMGTPGGPAVVSSEAASLLTKIATVDLFVFFALVLAAFAYVWKRGDLDWVRSVARQRAMEASARPPTEESQPQPALSA